MSRKGTRKYRCDECKEESFHHWIERNRSARMHCPGCGSTRLELVAQEARDDQTRLARVRITGHRDALPTREPPNKKVT